MQHDGDLVTQNRKVVRTHILTADKLQTAKETMRVLHPLPRVNEISVAVDKDPRACYFKQVLYGKYMRMALILKLLKEAETDKLIHGLEGEELVEGRFTCHNPKCITASEQELAHIFKLTDKESNIYRCIYCETRTQEE